MDSLYENPRSGNVSMKDLIPKKVRFREEGGIKSGEVFPDVPLNQRLHGRTNWLKSVVNGTPSIEFSKRINQILVKDMENTIVLELLGCNIDDSTLVGILQSNTKFPEYCDVVDQNFGNA
ncbi:hypothetical protein Gorai_003313, partial [Gossypium raimondii]|nr:hypothetical protein [Gossypium raimondii]